MKLLPHWCITNINPGFYDTESGTTIEQTAKVYKAMNELIAEYNSFADSVNTKITEFMNGSNEDNEAFKIGLRQEFQDFIDIVDLKIEALNQYAKNEIAVAIKDLYNELKESNEIVDIFGDELQELSNKFTSLSNRINTLSSDTTYNINQAKTELRAEMDTNNSTLRAEMNTNNSTLRAEMDTNNSTLRAEMNTNNSTLRAEMDTNNSTLREENLFSARIPAFEDIDNTPFKDMLKLCASNWFKASSNPGIVYESLSTDDVDNMSISMNPMLYSTRNNKEFTGVYRDIYAETKAGGTKAMNCITLANMIVMGVSFECSRFNNAENVVGSMGYGFDVCKYIDSVKDGNNISYNPNKKLDVSTFEKILTQASFTETYSKLGLVKTLKTTPSSSDGDIWYDSIKPGDVLFNSSHTMFCLDVITDSNTGVTTVSYIDSGHNNEPSIKYHTFTFTATSTNKTLLRVIRPYYNFYSPTFTNLVNYMFNEFKSIDGPYPGIGANEDLNTYLIPGEYRCASDPNAKTLLNKPETLNYAFKLTVENLLDDIEESKIKYKYLKQTITVSTSGTIYYRIVKCNPDLSIVSTQAWKIITATEVTA